jgi:hypothetical protein
MKLPEAQLKILQELNTALEAAKAKMDLVIGTIVLGKVKSGQMVEVRDGFLVLEVESEKDVLEEGCLTPVIVPDIQPPANPPVA